MKNSKEWTWQTEAGRDSILKRHSMYDSMYDRTPVIIFKQLEEG